ncbi:uncharacterized protein [Nicotiana sylvestris]|uniref:uncharacterized protein n=1 Tax=Nicotiana sylvestris TaxID=4096 RepID=UPI00388C6CC5
MAGKGYATLKVRVGVTTNILNTTNEDSREDNENGTPNTTPRGDGSPPPQESVTASREKEASISTIGEAPPAVRRLLEEWLTSTLNNILDKPSQRDNRDIAHVDVTTIADERDVPRTGNTHTAVDAGNDTLVAVLKKMEEMENENKALCDQMKEHQERVEKILGAPKLLPKWDVSRFVEQPYNEEASPYAIPKTFKMPPYLKIYDGTTDPEDHIIHYVTIVKDNDLSKEQEPSVLLKKFGKNLIGVALDWYSKLPACSITTFEEMADKFVTTYAGAKKVEARVNDIFSVRQMHDEGLLSSVKQGKNEIAKCVRGNGGSSLPERTKQEQVESDQKIIK